MRYAGDDLKLLYQLPIEKIKLKAFDRTWHARELVELLDGLENLESRQSELAELSIYDGQSTLVARSTVGLPLDPGLVSEEYYVRRVGFDRFLLLHGEYFNLNAENLTQWHDLRNLISCAA